MTILDFPPRPRLAEPSVPEPSTPTALLGAMGQALGTLQLCASHNLPGGQLAAIERLEEYCGKYRTMLSGTGDAA